MPQEGPSAKLQPKFPSIVDYVELAQHSEFLPMEQVPRLGAPKEGAFATQGTNGCTDPYL